MKIIFCDGIEKNLDMYRDYIKQYESPYIDAVYTNKHSALVESCKSQTPDVIVTDIVSCLPDDRTMFENLNPEFYSGIEAIQEIKSELENDIYVVVISENIDSDYVIKSVNAGANKYLQKPVSFEVFSSIIKEKEEKLFLEILLEDAWSFNEENRAHEVCNCIRDMASAFSSHDILGFASSFNKWKSYKIPIKPSYFIRHFYSSESDYEKQYKYIEKKLTELFCLTNDAGIVRKILGFVDENIFNPSMSLDMVATHFCCSESSISMIFKNTLNKNFSKYIQEHRMIKAKKLLLTTNKSVKDIAVECGYSYSNYFIKKFVQKEGLTPSNWRKAK